MKHIRSEYDKDTIYSVGVSYVSVQREGEVMRIPFRQIPTVMKVFREEIQTELMVFYEERYPMIACPICGKEFRKNGTHKYCSEECKVKARKIAYREKYEMEFKAAGYTKCKYCGKPFKPLSGKYKYCSDECRKKAHSKAKTRKPRKDPLALSRINREARSQGLTYGQLQAQKYIEQMKGVLE